MAHDIFISYSNKDKETADAVCNILEGRRIRCWMAPRDVPVGIPYPRALVNAIESSGFFVLIYSANSNNSGHVFKEIDQAAKAFKPIIPFRIEDVKPKPEIDYYISTQHWLDALTSPIEQHIHRLADEILKLLEEKNTDTNNMPTEVPEPLANPITPAESSLQVSNAAPRQNRFKSFFNDLLDRDHKKVIRPEQACSSIPVKDGSHVFISYANADRSIADAVCKKLESKYIKCWIAPRDIKPGCLFEEEIVKGLDNAAILILIFSSRSNHSGVMENEASIAWKRGISIVTFRVDDSPLNKTFEFYIHPAYRMDVTKAPLEDRLEELSTNINLILQIKKEKQADRL